MTVLLWAAVLVAGLVALVYAAGAFLRSAESIGLHFGISPFVLGVSVVAIGTSFPELVSGIAAVLQGAPEIAVGTAVGSNVTNILLILGVAAMIGKGLTIDYELVSVDLPFLFGSALMLWFFGYDGEVSALEGAISLAALGAYISYALSIPEEHPTTVGLAASEAFSHRSRKKAALPVRVWLVLAASAVVTQVGAYYTVVATVKLAALLEVGREIVATTAIATGTSLPELAVSARAARDGKPEIAVGNVIGSNIFNALGVVGLSALVGGLVVPASLTGFALPAMVGVTILAFFVLQEREMTRWDAWLLLTLYLAFLLQVVRLG